MMTRCLVVPAFASIAFLLNATPVVAQDVDCSRLKGLLDQIKDIRTQANRRGADAARDYEVLKGMVSNPDDFRRISGEPGVLGTFVSLGVRSQDVANACDDIIKQADEVIGELEPLWNTSCSGKDQQAAQGGRGGDTRTTVNVNKPIDDATKDAMVGQPTYPPGTWVLKTTLNPTGKELVDEVGVRGRPGRSWEQDRISIASGSVTSKRVRETTTSKGETRIAQDWSFEFLLESDIPAELKPGVPITITIDAKATPHTPGRLYWRHGVGVSWTGFKPSGEGSPNPGSDVTVGHFEREDRLGAMKEWSLVPDKGARAYSISIHLGGWGVTHVYEWVQQK